MMRNLLVRASVNSVIDSTVLTFYSITSKIGPSLDIGKLLILTFTRTQSDQDAERPGRIPSQSLFCLLLPLPLPLLSQGRSQQGCH